MASVSYQIQQAVQTILRAANLSGIDSAAIKIREMPKAGETLDPLPCVIISPYGKRSDKPADFEGHRDRTYKIEIALIDGTEGDYATDQELYQGWQEDAADAIVMDGDFSRNTLTAVPSVWEINVEDIAEFDRSSLAVNYAYQSIVIRFESQE